MSEVMVFAGPTVPERTVAKELPGARCLPPVAQGDILRAVWHRPRVIAIIDGYFERFPAVWHSEILWAMSRGVHVLGSGSMGALRAAELAPLGMQGVGWIFEAYRDGRLEDDDEVAVAHTGAEDGYRPVSEPMVSIRCTLNSALREGVIDAPTTEELLRTGKGLHYADRTYPRLLELASVAPSQLARLRAWLPEHRIDQKRADAITMLRLIRTMLEEDLAPKTVDFTFNRTELWDRARRLAGTAAAGQPSDGVTLDRLIDELRLNDEWFAVHQEAMLRALALEAARRHGIDEDPQALAGIVEQFRRERGLVDAEQVERWLVENDLSPSQFTDLLTDQALLHWAHAWASPATADAVADHLRVAGRYAALRRRAEEKQRTLERYGLPNPSLDDAGVTEGELLEWWFVGRLGVPPPPDLDAWSRRVGFPSPTACRAALLREYCATERRW